MIFKILRFLFIFNVLLSACKVQKDSIVGIYESSKPSLFEQYTKYRGFFGTLGIHLYINEDSTYQLKTCSDSSSGRWRVEGCDLILSKDYKIWNNDSMNIAIPIDNTNLKLNPKLLKLRIENGDITCKFFVYTDDKNRKENLLIYLRKKK